MEHQLVLPITCLVLALLWPLILGLSTGEEGTYHDYCVIGAGPAGLQMGYFFTRAGRDYVIFEKSNVSGKCLKLTAELPPQIS